MRGYGRSSPTDPHAYTPLHTVGDLVAILDVLNIGQATVAGHDFGANVAWHAASMRPDRFVAVFGMSVPYRPRGARSYIELFREAGREEFYMFRQMAPGAAEAWSDAAVSYPSVLYWSSGSPPEEDRWDPFDADRTTTLPVHYFGTKEAVLIATADHVIASYDVVIREKLGDADGTRAIRIIVRSYPEQALEHPTERRALAIILAEAATNPLLQTGIAALTRRGAQEFAKFIRQAQARGEVAVDVDAERLGMVMLASLRGLVALWLVDPDIDLRSLGEQLEASLMQSLQA
jgi:AcrR family transcriptional regulator